MTAKECLRQIGTMDRRISLDVRRLEELRQLSEKISGGGFERSFNPNRAQEAPFVKTMDRVMDLEQKITKEIDDYIAFKEQALEMIRRVADFDQREVLEMRYVRRMPWEKIAADMRYSIRWVYVLHSRALQAFEQIMAEKST